MGRTSKSFKVLGVCVLPLQEGFPFPVHPHDVCQSSLEPPEVLQKVPRCSLTAETPDWRGAGATPPRGAAGAVNIPCTDWKTPFPALSCAAPSQQRSQLSGRFSPCLFERGTLLLLYQSLADIACSYEQMLCGCKQSVGETGSVFNIDKEQNGGLFKLCTDNFSIIKGVADTIPCLQMK